MKFHNFIGLTVLIKLTYADCWSNRLGFPCCSYTNDIILTDQDGSWGLENGNWCGITASNQNSGCWSLALGFQCCANTNEVVYTDQDGQWGLENGNWCGILKTTTNNSCWSSSLGYPCCQYTKEVIETDSDGQWGFENGNWCGLTNISNPTTPTPTTTTTTTTTTKHTQTQTAVTTPFPKAQKHIVLNEPYIIKSGEVYDGLEINGVWTSYGRGVTGQGDCKDIEGGKKDAVFRLESGATLKNVILGADSIEHVHCIGDGCTVENVWWDDVCEDALTLTGSTNQNAKFYVIGGGARDGSDKIVQHNSSGTVHIKGFTVSNSGKLYRACGNCKSGYQGFREVIIEDVNASNVGVLAGINSNYGDKATFINVNANGGNVCYLYTGNNVGSEPSKIGSQCKNQSYCVCQ